MLASDTEVIGTFADLEAALRYGVSQVPAYLIEAIRTFTNTAISA